jgi:hypothetical protein
MSLVMISIIALILGSTADGISTVYAIGKGNVEVDPIMLKIFGTNRPSARRIFLRGGIAVALESAITLTAAHFGHSAGIVLGSVLLAQSVYHCWATYHNYDSVRHVRV